MTEEELPSLGTVRVLSLIGSKEENLREVSCESWKREEQVTGGNLR